MEAKKRIDMNENSEKINLSKPDRPDLSLAIPCYNEEDSLQNTITRLVKCFQEREINLELVIVDNGSIDNTGKVIDELIEKKLPIIKKTVKNNQGYGNGILCGLPFCHGKFVGFICADGQVAAEDVVKVYEAAAKMKTPKLVKVRRRFRMDGLVRKIVSTIYNVMISVMFGGLGSIDINGNPKVFPYEYLERMKLQSTDWFLDAEVMIKSKWLGLEVYEFNIFAQMREGGNSNVNTGTLWEFFVNILKYRLGKKYFYINSMKNDNNIVPDKK